MFAVFLRSVAHHAQWFFVSFLQKKNKGASLSGKRMLFLIFGYPAFCALQLMHWFGFLCDEVLFADYKKVEIRRPLFISGIPRSGTTFVHRTLAHAAQFTSFTTWEALLAPSITERKIIRWLAGLDRIFGAPGKKLIHTVIQKSTGDFNSIHEVGLDAAEEDYLALLPAGGCFILLLAFPFSTQLKSLAMLDKMDPKQRQGLTHFYKRMVQKHLYCAPENARFLSKNAAFASWMPELQTIFPDSQCIICVREPASALSSQLSSLQPARDFFATDPSARYTTELFTEIFAHNYALLVELCQSADRAQIALLDQTDLRQDSGGIIRSCLSQLEVKNTPELDEALAGIKRSSSSSHSHKTSDFPFDSDQIQVCIQPSYKQLLRSGTRVFPKS
ncbi:MAG: sulfotransferase [Verrucomicrobiota bacterium]